jgi:hypothetical protein
MTLDRVFGVASAVYLIVCAIQNGLNARRVGFVAFAVLSMTSVIHLVFVLLNKFMLFALTHVTVALMIVFLLHCGGAPKYTEFDPSKADTGATVINIDQITRRENEATAFCRPCLAFWAHLANGFLRWRRIF